jgi:hypothetical protein
LGGSRSSNILESFVDRLIVYDLFFSFFKEKKKKDYSAIKELLVAHPQNHLISFLYNLIFSKKKEEGILNLIFFSFLEEKRWNYL